MGKIKVGDKLRCIDFMEDTNEDHFTIGEFYTVIRIHPDGDTGLVVINDDGRDWHTFVECFEQVRKYDGPPKDDYEWMDRVKENFEE